MHWGDSVPVTTVPDAAGGLYVSGVDNGFAFAVPPDPTPRTLKVLVTMWGGATGKLVAQLSDLSASDVVDTGLRADADAGFARGAYAITYRSALANQLLTVRWTTHDRGRHGNLTIVGAALSPAPTVAAAGQ